MPVVPGYEKLHEIFAQAVADVNGERRVSLALSLAYQQSAGGKGAERHANEKPWLKQPILDIQRLTGWAFAVGQAMKKTQEASRMDPKHAAHELLGACVYLAGAHAFSEEIQDVGIAHLNDHAQARDMSEKPHYQDLLEEMARIATLETYAEERTQIRRCLAALGRLIAIENEEGLL